jgi:hypothetical protein
MSRWLLANYLSVLNLDALRAPSIVWLVYYSGARSRFNLESSIFSRFYHLGLSINDVTSILIILDPNPPALFYMEFLYLKLSFGVYTIQSYIIKSPTWTILWLRILRIFSVENTYKEVVCFYVSNLRQ